MNIQQALVGALLSDNSMIATIAGIVSEEDFTDIESQSVFNFIYSRWQDNKTTDLIIAFSLLKDKVSVTCLSEATSIGIPAVSINYAEQVAEEAKLNRLRTSLHNIANDSLADSNDIIAQVSSAVISEACHDDDITDSKSCVDEFDNMLTAGGVVGLSTGYSVFDNLDIAMVKGDYWVVGAATSVGKTAFALNIFCYLLENDNAKVCIISTEMTRKQILSRVIAYFTNIPATKIIKNLTGNNDKKIISDCMAWLKQRTFFISEKTFEISQIENKVRSLTMKHDLDVVIIDYLQHCRSKDYKDKYSVLTNVTARLQELAKVSETCILALSQLSNEASKNTKGNLEFKGSGDIAGDCDVGIVLSPSPNDPAILKAYIKKNRHGARGEAGLKYSKSYARLEECNW